MQNTDHDYMRTPCLSSQLNFNPTPKIHWNSDSEKVNHLAQQQHKEDNCSGQPEELS